MSAVKEVALAERKEEAPLQPAALDINSLAVTIERLAANPQVDVAKLEKVIELQERILANQAKAAFDEAFALMQGEIPVIRERGKADKSTYAPREDIVEQVRPILARHGFAISHETGWPDKSTVEVIGILTHRLGHEKRSRFLSSADTSGSKNGVQAFGSAIEYGRRYTTTDLLNIVTRGGDDDGRKAGQPAAPEGFDDWWVDLTTTAEDGTAVLKAAWDQSPVEFKRHVAKTNPKSWEDLKRKAAKVGQ